MYKCPNCDFQGAIYRFTPHDPVSNDQGRWCPKCWIALWLTPEDTLDIYTNLDNVIIAKWFVVHYDELIDEPITQIRRKHSG